MRRKEISLVSISPLDRILNQATQRDQIIIRVGCDDDFNKFQRRDYDFDFNTNSINKVTCQNGKMLDNPGQACQIG